MKLTNAYAFFSNVTDIAVTANHPVFQTTLCMLPTLQVGFLDMSARLARHWTRAAFLRESRPYLFVKRNQYK